MAFKREAYAIPSPRSTHNKEIMTVDWLATQQRERRGTVNLRSSAAALLLFLRRLTGEYTLFLMLARLIFYKKSDGVSPALDQEISSLIFCVLSDSWSKCLGCAILSCSSTFLLGRM
jgi:hypothetical protein